MPKPPNDPPDDLRRRANEKLRTTNREGHLLASNEYDLKHALSELHIHRLELEMQNKELQEAQQQADLQARQYHSLFEFSPVGLLLTETDGVIVDVNQALGECLRLPRGKLIGRAINRFAAADDRDSFYFLFKGAQESGQAVSKEITLVLPDGDTIDVRITTRPFRYADCEGEILLSAVEDISDFKNAERRLRLDASVFHYAAEGIVIIDPDGTVVDVNEAFSVITEFPHEEAIGRFADFLMPDDTSKLGSHNPFEVLKETGHLVSEHWAKTRSGKSYVRSLNINSILNSNGRLRNYVALLSDKTEQFRYQQQLQRMAHYDQLTGLPNRALLLDRLKQAMAMSKRLEQTIAVAFLDLDGFKEINDRYGHKAGDQLLVTLAHRFRSVIREEDTIGRMGGDEFVAVFVSLDSKSDYMTLIGRLLNVVQSPVRVQDESLTVSCSIGVTLYPQDEDVDSEKLLRQCDRGMYQAKLAGKNCCKLFDEAEDKNLRGHHSKIERVREALLADELELYYQPKVNLQSGEVLGVEALLRWRHPTHGLLPPGTFLPGLTHDPLAAEVDNWVVEHAISQLSEWRHNGLKTAVSVNVGAEYLAQPGLPDRLHGQFAQYPEVPPSALEIEVLETCAMDDIARFSEVLAGCIELGVRFALDDFGTGYSSLAYLKALPIATLKIDQSFVRNMLIDVHDMTILEAIVGLGDSFGREVIAEGIETPEHCEYLLRIGCNCVQGNYLSHPMQAADLSGWIGAWKPNPEWASIQPVSERQRPLLFASILHRAWSARVLRHRQMQINTSELDDIGKCGFSKWLDSDGAACFQGTAEFSQLVELYRQIRCTAEIVSKVSPPLTGSSQVEENFQRQSQDLLKLIKRMYQLPALDTANHPERGGRAILN